MAQIEIHREKNEAGDGIVFRFHSAGQGGDVLLADAELHLLSRQAFVTLSKVDNMAAALYEIVETLKHEILSRFGDTDPTIPLQIDINAGKFTKELEEVGPRFGFTGPQPAGELGTEGQFVRFRATLPLKK